MESFEKWQFGKDKDVADIMTCRVVGFVGVNN